MKMPDKLKLFLETLPPEDYDEFINYLDGDPDAIHDMIALIVSSSGEGNR